jgi:voltage-gated potassium channel Kch
MVEAQLLAFHDSVYFIIVTLATVGYGDIPP